MTTKPPTYIVLDTETTGLNSFQGDRPFLVSIRENGETVTYRLPAQIAEVSLRVMSASRIVGHNIRFDMQMLRSIGIEAPINCTLWCTLVMERVLYNDHLSYSLDACGKRLGLEKSSAVKDWIEKNHAYTVDKDTKVKRLHYDRVPMAIIVPYAEVDVMVTDALYRKQCEAFRAWDLSPVPIKKVVKLELQTTKALLEMEATGIKLDREYCERAFAHEERRRAEIAARIMFVCKQPFVDSAKFLKPIFASLGLKAGKTEKGNASFTADVLEPLKGKHEIIDHILAYRDSVKRGNTYFKGLLRECGRDGRIHANIKQSGAATGRMSCANPNAQNWPAHDDGEFPVRRSLVADEGFDILSIDYAQMELRLMVDEANEKGMIDAIVKGKDFHQELASMAGVSRDLAKNGRFAKLYGAGVDRLASTLGIEKKLAQSLSEALEKQTPCITKYCNGLINHAKRAPYGYSLTGRRFYFTDKNFCFKMPNYRIQGGCADILRLALIACNQVLVGYKSKVLMLIHDEIVFSLAKDERHLIPLLKQAMIDAYKPKHLPMDVSASLGPNLWDLEAI